MIISIEDDSPADKAGLLERDVIIGFDEEAIASIDDLHKVLTQERVGVKSSLTIIRRSEKLVLNIVPEESAAVQRSSQLLLGKD